MPVGTVVGAATVPLTEEPVSDEAEDTKEPDSVEVELVAVDVEDTEESDALVVEFTEVEVAVMVVRAE